MPLIRVKDKMYKTCANSWSGCTVLMLWDTPYSECARCREHQDEGGSG